MRHWPKAQPSFPAPASAQGPGLVELMAQMAVMRRERAEVRGKLDYRPTVWVDRQQLIENLPAVLRSRGFLDQLIREGVIKPFRRPHRKTPIFDLHESLRAADQAIRNGVLVQGLARESTRARELELQRRRAAAWREAELQAPLPAKAC